MPAHWAMESLWRGREGGREREGWEKGEMEEGKRKRIEGRVEGKREKGGVV